MLTTDFRPGLRVIRVLVAWCALAASARAATQTLEAAAVNCASPSELAIDLATYSGAMVGRVTPTSAVVNVVTSETLSRAIEVNIALATNASGPFVIDDERRQVTAFPSTAVEIALSSLTPDTRYFYYVIIRAPADSENVELLCSPDGRVPTFRTAPLPGTGTAKFIVFADAHDEKTGWDVTRPQAYWATRVVQDALRAGPPDFFLQLGDWVSPWNRTDPRPPLEANASANSWYAQNRNGPYAPVYGQGGWFHVLGNHENEGWPKGNAPEMPWEPTDASIENTAARKLFFVNPVNGTPDVSVADPIGNPMEDYYDFIWGNVHIIVINPFVAGRYGDIGDAQYYWLENVLKHSSARHVLVCAHYMCLTNISELGDPPNFGPYWDGGSAGRNPEKWHYRVHRLFKRYGVDAFMFGHVHRFSHSIVDGVNYISIGVPSIDTGSPLNSGFEDGVVSLHGEMGYCEVSEVGTALRMRWRRAAFATPGDDVPFNWSTDAQGQPSSAWAQGPVYSDDGARGPLVDVQHDIFGFYVTVPPETRTVRGVYRPADIQPQNSPPLENLWQMPASMTNVYDLDFTDSSRVNLTGDPGVPQVNVDFLPYTFHTIDLHRAAPMNPQPSGDTDNDGDVDLRDRARMSSCVDAMDKSGACASVDANGDAQIDESDYVSLAGGMTGPRPDLRFDLDNDGAITQADLLPFLRRLTGPFGTEQIAPAGVSPDIDGDGDVDLSDYAAMQRAAGRR